MNTEHPPVESMFASKFSPDVAEGLRRGALAGLALVVLLLPPAGRLPGHGDQGSLPRASQVSMPLSAEPWRDGQVAAEGVSGRPDFQGEPTSPEVRQVVQWIAASRDNRGMDFVIVDKRYTKVYVFGADARLRGATPVLLGAMAGDDSVPGIGSRPIAEVRPEERTTPAGRFIGERGRNTLGEDVVWVDYDAAVSMHRVRLNNPAERRLERLASATIDDNRISYGCINVPVAFYERFIRPTFATHRAVVYVLPEIKPVKEVFAGVSEVADTALSVGASAATAAFTPS